MPLETNSSEGTPISEKQPSLLAEAYADAVRFLEKDMGCTNNGSGIWEYSTGWSFNLNPQFTLRDGQWTVRWRTSDEWADPATREAPSGKGKADVDKILVKLAELNRQLPELVRQAEALLQSQMDRRKAQSSLLVVSGDKEKMTAAQRRIAEMRETAETKGLQPYADMLLEKAGIPQGQFRFTQELLEKVKMGATAMRDLTERMGTVAAGNSAAMERAQVQLAQQIVFSAETILSQFVKDNLGEEHAQRLNTARLERTQETMSLRSAADQLRIISDLAKGDSEGARLSALHYVAKHILHLPSGARTAMYLSEIAMTSTVNTLHKKIGIETGDQQATPLSKEMQKRMGIERSERVVDTQATLLLSFADKQVELLERVVLPVIKQKVQEFRARGFSGSFESRANTTGSLIADWVSTPFQEGSRDRIADSMLPAFTMPAMGGYAKLMPIITDFVSTAFSFSPDVGQVLELLKSVAGALAFDGLAFAATLGAGSAVKSMQAASGLTNVVRAAQIGNTALKAARTTNTVVSMTNALGPLRFSNLQILAAHAPVGTIAQLAEQEVRDAKGAKGAKMIQTLEGKLGPKGAQQVQRLRGALEQDGLNGVLKEGAQGLQGALGTQAPVAAE